MKALIVDDNPSVIAILAEILKIDGHEVYTAATWDDAKRELEIKKPDIMFLDSIVNQVSMISFVDELDENINTRIVLILNGKEQVPRDTVLIVRSIKKPFNSTEVLEAVKFVGGGCVECSREVKKKKSRKFRFWMSSKDGSEPVEKIISEDDVVIGRSYAVFEDVPNKIYELASKFITCAGDILIITSERKKTVENRVTSDNCTVMPLSRTSRSGYTDIKALGTLLFDVMQFIDGSRKPVVIIDDLGQLIVNNDLNTVLTFIHQMYTGTEKQFTLGISVKESMLTEKDKSIIMGYMELYKPDDEEV